MSKCGERNNTVSSRRREHIRESIIALNGQISNLSDFLFERAHRCHDARLRLSVEMTVGGKRRFPCSVSSLSIKSRSRRSATIGRHETTMPIPLSCGMFASAKNLTRTLASSSTKVERSNSAHAMMPAVIEETCGDRVQCANPDACILGQRPDKCHSEKIARRETWTVAVAPGQRWKRLLPMPEGVLRKPQNLPNLTRG